MDSYDKTKIGKKIAGGGDRKVYMYGADKVIKFSSLALFVGEKLRHKYKHDYEVCKDYFGDYVVETVDVSGNTTRRSIEMQPFIAGELLCMRHTRDPQVRAQLQDIALRLQEMRNDGSPVLDLIGSVGMIRPCLSNIIVDASDKLHIVDTVLLEGKTVRPFGIVFEVFLPLILARQNYLLRQFLQL